ncbi:MAG TPA: hypothetical protein VI874_00460, partial [Candidatus Norongarragalinales archaeon]|nr:hypothetical protein [Candidatus Norongarragalinales archaeon]
MKTFFAILLLSLLLFGCTQTSPPASTPLPSYPAAGSIEAQNLPLEKAQAAMVNDMAQNGGDPSVSAKTIIEDKGFSGTKVRSGIFKAIGYMTSGSASLQVKDGKTFVVFSDDFSTPNGPDVVVYLTKNKEPTTREDI